MRAVERAATTWARRAHDLRRAETALAGAGDRLREAEETCGDAGERLRVDEGNLAEVNGRLHALESTIGVEYRDTLERIGSRQRERATRKQRRDQLTGTRPALDKRIGQLESALAEAEREHVRADDARAEMHRRFTTIVIDGFAGDARVSVGDGEMDGVTAVLGAARHVAADLDGLPADEAALDRAQAKVQERLHHAQGPPSAAGSTWPVELQRRAAGGSCARRAGGLRRRSRRAGRGAGRRAGRRAGPSWPPTRSACSSRRWRAACARRWPSGSGSANQLVDGINRQLGAVRTEAGGVAVRLRWEVDADQPDAVQVGARAAAARPGRPRPTTRRAALQDFVRARVDQARAELRGQRAVGGAPAARRSTTGPGTASRCSSRHRDWDGLPARHRPAAASGCRPASGRSRCTCRCWRRSPRTTADVDGQPSGCPRLILLDELFAGVDAANRAQLFGTFTAWDLDAVFTSDHEWCQYATPRRHRHPPPPPADRRRAGDLDPLHLGRPPPADRPHGGLVSRVASHAATSPARFTARGVLGLGFAGGVRRPASWRPANLTHRSPPRTHDSGHRRGR